MDIKRFLDPNKFGVKEQKLADAWENFVSLKSQVEPDFTVLGKAADYHKDDKLLASWKGLDYEASLARDTFPLPETKDREGYYGPNHFSYWASGLVDANNALDAAKTHGTTVETFLDIGCASGRVIRHVGVQHPEIETLGCDINRHHVEWCNEYLPDNLKVFHNHSLPNLPMADASVDVVTAFSVLTHIEAFETSWLMEINRILKPGGIAWLTVHTEHTLAEMDETWPLYKAVMNHPKIGDIIDKDRKFPGNRAVVRYHTDRSYSSNVFYKQDYLMSVWGRFFEIAEFRRRCPKFQDVMILKKK